VSGRTAQGAQIRVWDLFVRLFHWGTVALFATAFLSSDEKSLHEPVGYVLLALVVLRTGWGFVGTRHARFTSFVVSPRSVLGYLRLLREGRAPRHLGHNPAGGLMILLLLAMLVLVAGSGWMTETDRWFGVPWVDHLHHISAHLLLLLIGVHVTGVVISSWLHGENLVRAMITGRKPVDPLGSVATDAGTAVSVAAERCL
jgi:cytochrome b